MSPPSDAVTCARCEERLEAWLDGMLDPIDAARVEDHVTRCPSCAESASLARAVLRDLHDLPELEPPTSVLAGVRTATRSRPRAMPWRRRPAALAAAAVVVAALSALLLFRGSAPTEADRIGRASLETRYALGVVARAGRTAGRELGISLNDGLAARRTAAEIGRALDRARPSQPEILDVHGG